MKRFVFFLILFMYVLNSYGQIYKFGRKVQPGYVFGVRIAPGWSSVTTFFEGYYNGYNLSDVMILNKNDLILKMFGREKSLANPDHKNLFVQYKIKNIGVIDSLWKLRYAVYPFRLLNSTDTLGWSNNLQNPFIPSPKQNQILYNLGMDTNFYVILGDNFLHLLSLMCDPNWVKSYKNAK